MSTFNFKFSGKNFTFTKSDLFALVKKNYKEGMPKAQLRKKFSMLSTQSIGAVIANVNR